MNTKICLAGFVCLTAAGPAQAQNAPDQRPNILFIMSDDHTAQAISAYGGILSTVLPTPNIDRIGEEGVRLNNCYATNSISTPSRGAILTGQYSHRNQVYTLHDPLSPSLPNVAKELQSGGYQTAVVGKWHLHAEPTGFDWYNVFPGQGRYHNPILIEKGNWGSDPNKEKGYKGTKYEGHSSDVVASQAISYLEHRDKDKPFFLMCHFKAPHRPWQPAERFKDLLKDVTVPEPDNLLDTYDGKAAYSRQLHMSLEHMDSTDLKCAIPKGMTRDEQRRWAYQLYIKDYLRCVAGVDENVGRILDYLDQNGLTENTIVIYTGDQGFFLGEHGWFDKRLMYEESMRMPFLIRYPKEIKPGNVNTDITLNIDFAPTFLDFAGIKKPEYMQGESFRKNLTGDTPATWRKAMYYRYWQNADVYHNAPANYGIRTDRYKLIFYYGESLNKRGTAKRSIQPPGWELYDMVNDPHEMTNLYNDPKYQDIVKELKKQLLELKEQYGDSDDAYPVMQELTDKYF